MNTYQAMLVFMSITLFLAFVTFLLLSVSGTIRDKSRKDYYKKLKRLRAIRDEVLNEPNAGRVEYLIKSLPGVSYLACIPLYAEGKFKVVCELHNGYRFVRAAGSEREALIDLFRYLYYKAINDLQEEYGDYSNLF